LYDEVFLIVREGSGNAITLGRLDEAFAEAEQALRTRLEGFSSDWWAAARALALASQRRFGRNLVS
jgi:hypothetical protein